MTQNSQYIELDIVEVNRADLVLPEASVPGLLREARERGFSRRVDAYDDVFLVLPWSAKQEGLVEFARLIFEFSGSRRNFRTWLGECAARLQLSFEHVAAARRGSVRQLKSPNPNPNKWYNRQWPVSRDYATNLANGYRLLSAEPIGPLRLEVICPLATDDLGLICAGFLERYPAARLIEVAPGFEHAIDPAAGKEMNQAAARLLFDVSALVESDHHPAFASIESMHSFIVPVMRIFTEHPRTRDEDFRWGL